MLEKLCRPERSLLRTNLVIASFYFYSSAGVEYEEGGVAGRVRCDVISRGRGPGLLTSGDLMMTPHLRLGV